MGFLKPKINIPKQDVQAPTPPTEEAGVVEDQETKDKRKNTSKSKLKVAVQDTGSTGVNTGSTTGGA